MVVITIKLYIHLLTCLYVVIFWPQKLHLTLIYQFVINLFQLLSKISEKYCVQQSPGVSMSFVIKVLLIRKCFTKL